MWRARKRRARRRAVGEPEHLALAQRSRTELPSEAVPRPSQRLLQHVGLEWRHCGHRLPTKALTAKPTSWLTGLPDIRMLGMS
jgi:hypothetical protein